MLLTLILPIITTRIILLRLIVLITLIPTRILIIRIILIPILILIILILIRITLIILPAAQIQQTLQQSKKPLKFKVQKALSPLHQQSTLP